MINFVIVFNGASYFQTERERVCLVLPATNMVNIKYKPDYISVRSIRMKVRSLWYTLGY